MVHEYEVPTARQWEVPRQLRKLEDYVYIYSSSSGEVQNRAKEIYSLYSGTAWKGELQESKRPQAACCRHEVQSCSGSELLHAGHIYRHAAG